MIAARLSALKTLGFSSPKGGKMLTGTGLVISIALIIAGAIKMTKATKDYQFSWLGVGLFLAGFTGGMISGLAMIIW